jgi:capsular polysaccharide transport system ATP-binding protein
MMGMSNCTRIVESPLGPRIVLNRIDFGFPDSARIGILCEPGMARATMVKLFLGLDVPDIGTVVPPARMSAPLGSTGAFHPAISGGENVRMVAGAMGEDPDRVSIYCQRFAELGPAFDRPLAEYTGAMRGRLGFAFSMALPATTILADETTETGEGLFRDRCRAALRSRLKTSGLMLFSRRPKATAALCDHHLVLRDSVLTICPDHESAKILFEADRHDTEAEQLAEYFDVA